MEVFLSLLDILFKITVRLSLMGGVIVAAILLIKLITRNKSGIKFQYAIWFILILRLMMPVTPQSRISIYNYIPQVSKNVYTADYNELSKMIINADASRVQTGNRTEAKTEEAAKPVLLADHGSSYTNEVATYTKTDAEINLKEHMLPLLWISTLLFGLIALLVLNIKFAKRVKKGSVIYDEGIIGILEDCKQTIGVRGSIGLIETNAVKSPAVYGFIKPRILVPNNILEESNLVHLRYALLHELAHIKRKDIFINYLTVILSLVHWFNPLIWLGFHCMREDREQCCDSHVLFSLKDSERIGYGSAIIGLAEIYSKPVLLPGMAGLINNKSKTRKRIIMIKDFKRKSYRFSASTLSILVMLGCVMLTSANALPKSEDNTKAIINSAINREPQQKVFDKIDYPFVNDEMLIGKWETVDFVKDIDDFNPSITSLTSEPFLLSMTLLNNGGASESISGGQKRDENTPLEWLKWTKGYIINTFDVTASEYTIKEIDGTQYLFMQWKEGSYMIKGLKPGYYVLRKYDPSKPRPAFKAINVIEDKIDYPFVNDEKLIGKWKTVDYVYEIENFDPQRIIRHKDLSVKGMTILSGGSVSESYYGEIQGSEDAVSYAVTWTKGYIIDHLMKTASHYTIKNIKGSEYLFMEWKSGDYTIRGMKPAYYVMKRSE